VASNATSDGRSQTLLADVAVVEAGAPDAPATNTTTRGDWTARMREARELFRLREYRQAEEKLLEAIAIGDDHGPTGQRVATTWILLERIADHYQDDRDVAGTARVGPTLIAVGSRIHGPSNPRLVPHRSALADALAAQGDLEAERGVLLEALAETSGDAKDDFTLRLARLEIEDSNPGAAGPLLEALLERNPPGPAAENAAVLRIASLHALAEVRALEARETEAEALFVQARDEASALAPGSTSLALVHKGLAAFYLEQDRGAEAEAEARAGLALLASHSGTEASQLEVQAMLAASLDRQARTLETEAAYDDGLALAESSPGAAAEALRAAYSEWLRSQGRGEDADRIAAPSGAPEAFPREPTG
jgi:tetratricopeptide (TPR) repeat protein